MLQLGFDLVADVFQGVVRRLLEGWDFLTFQNYLRLCPSPSSVQKGGRGCVFWKRFPGLCLRSEFFEVGGTEHDVEFKG